MTGELYNNTAKIELKDILPMNKGTGSYTEFESDERFPQFMSAKLKEHGPKVLQWKQGLIHSHNNMGVFFSTTDKDELYSNCGNFAQYLSLICNNRMEFVAKVAQKAKANEVDTELPIYVLNNEGKEVQIGKKSIKSTTSEIIEYDCKISSPKSSYTEDSVFMGFVNKLFKSKDTRKDSFQNWHQGSFFEEEKFEKELWYGKKRKTSSKKEDKFLEYFRAASKAEDIGGLLIQDADLESLTAEEYVDFYAQIVEGYTPELVVKDFKANIINNIIDRKIMGPKEIYKVINCLKEGLDDTDIISEHVDKIYTMLDEWESGLKEVIKKQKNKKTNGRRRKIKI